MTANVPTKSKFIVLAGSMGTGKTTIGKALALRLNNCEFIDGDDFHTAQNREKMRRGGALSDDDRRPWLETLNALGRGDDNGDDRLYDEHRRSIVLACSALKVSGGGAHVYSSICGRQMRR